MFGTCPVVQGGIDFLDLLEPFGAEGTQDPVAGRMHRFKTFQVSGIAQPGGVGHISLQVAQLDDPVPQPIHLFPRHGLFAQRAHRQLHHRSKAENRDDDHEQQVLFESQFQIRHPNVPVSAVVLSRSKACVSSSQ